ncbi:hypothetical protein TA3x_005115 [Tundrisphaera sp. TA3]|uniref:hypothetical protein n=1 Tax=Tundrisphaera sp. TA3 TaxID=3435775 RepID=UPI003EBD4212
MTCLVSSGKPAASAIVWTPAPGMLKAMLSAASAEALTPTMAARRELEIGLTSLPIIGDGQHREGGGGVPPLQRLDQGHSWEATNTAVVPAGGQEVHIAIPIPG